jgi:hypothetical protein
VLAHVLNIKQVTEIHKAIVRDHNCGLGGQLLRI